MADIKITDLSFPTDNYSKDTDLFEIVDTTDATQSPQGSSRKISAEQIRNTSLKIIGIWDAAANTTILWETGMPGGSLVSGVGTPWTGYGVYVSGNTNLDGTTVWNTGDLVLFNAITNTWMKDLVTFVNGMSGNVSLTTADIPDASGFRYTPDIPVNAVPFGSSDGEHLTTDVGNFYYNDSLISFTVSESSINLGNNCIIEGGSNHYIDEGSDTSSINGGVQNSFIEASSCSIDGGTLNTISTSISSRISSSNESTITNSNFSGVYDSDGCSITGISLSSTCTISSSLTSSISDCDLSGILNSESCTLTGGSRSSIVGSQNCAIADTENSFIINANNINYSSLDGFCYIGDGKNYGLIPTIENQFLIYFSNGIGINRQDALSGTNLTSLSTNYTQTAFSGANYNATSNDFQIGCAYEGGEFLALTLNLPDETQISIGRIIIIADETGNLGSANQITISSVNGYTINGLSTYEFTVPYGEVHFYWNGLQWIATSINSPTLTESLIAFGSTSNTITSDPNFSYLSESVSFSVSADSSNLGSWCALVGGTFHSIDENSQSSGIWGGNNCTLTIAYLSSITNSNTCAISNSTQTFIQGSLNSLISDCSYSSIYNGNNVSIAVDGVTIFSDGTNYDLNPPTPNQCLLYFSNGVGINCYPSAYVSFEVNGALSAGQAGIGTDMPQSTLDVNGSVAFRSTTINTGSYIALSSDIIILSAYTGISDVSIMLPTSIMTPGRIIIIKDANLSATLHPITIQGDAGQLFYTNTSATTVTIGVNGGSYRFVTDGISWYAI